MREIADILKIPKSSAENYLHQLGYVNHFDVWVPYKLSKKHLLDHISPWDSLLKHTENIPYLKQIVTGDETWILYNNVGQKRLWGKWNEPPPTTPKAGLHPKKVVLCIWWDWKWVLYCELLLENQMINSNKYCSQLDQRKAALNKKRPELVNRKRIIFHQDNTRLHVSLMTRQKLLQLGWEVLIHPPIQQTLHLWISIYLGLYKILLKEKISIPCKTVKGTCNSSLVKKIKGFGKMELWSCLKNGRR